MILLSERRTSAASSAIVLAWEQLLAVRQAQRGGHTFGDPADVTFQQAFCETPPNPQVARAIGVSLGRDVYARRYLEDHVPGAVRILSECLHDSGWGHLTLADHFNREARVTLGPGIPLLATITPVRDAFIGGILDGFFGQAFNTPVRVQTAGHNEFHITLLDGYDVNGGKKS